MVGLDRIIQIRRRGLKPVSVTLEPNAPRVMDLDTWIQYDPRDVPELFDLRALIGLFVAILGPDNELTARWAKAACKAGASTVMTINGKQSRDFRLYGVDLEFNS